MELNEKLLRVQAELKAPKNQRNNFGKYNYRNCEDILEAVKPLLLREGLTMTITDEVKELGGYLFVEASVSVFYAGDRHKVTAQAGIDPNRKGMDIAQSFGSSGSYARKYALNGMFLIDDTKDADTTNDGKPNKVKPTATDEILKKAKEKGATLEKVQQHYKLTQNQINNY